MFFGDPEWFTLGGTERCRLSLLTSDAPSYISPNAGGGGGSCVVQLSTAVHKSPNLTLYLTYGFTLFRIRIRILFLNLGQVNNWHILSDTAARLSKHFKAFLKKYESMKSDQIIKTKKILSFFVSVKLCSYARAFCTFCQFFRGLQSLP